MGFLSRDTQICNVNLCTCTYIDLYLAHAGTLFSAEMSFVQDQGSTISVDGARKTVSRMHLTYLSIQFLFVFYGVPHVSFIVATNN